MKTTEQIDRISRLSISSYVDSWIFIDSDELDLTGKMRLSEFIKFLQKGFISRGFKFSNGRRVSFSNGRVARVSV